MLYQQLSVSEWDGRILLWIQEHLRNDFLSGFFTFFTRLGDHGELWFGIMLLLLLLGTYRKTVVTAFFSMIVTFLAVDFLIKPWVARMRPYLVLDGLERLVAAERSFSFPSGHASTAFAVAYVLFRELPLRYGLPAMTLALTMAFSRMYVGVHYPSDVLIGTLIGVMVGEVCIRLRKRSS